MVKYIGEKDYEHGTKETVGILITNLGTPDAPEKKELKVYLNQFLSDPRVIELPRILWQILLKLVMGVSLPELVGPSFQSNKPLILS